MQQSLQPKLSRRRYASVLYALQNNTVFRCAQNWVSVSEGSRTDNGSEFQSVGPETAKHLWPYLAVLEHSTANTSDSTGTLVLFRAITTSLQSGLGTFFVPVSDHANHTVCKADKKSILQTITCLGSIPGAGHSFRYVINQPPKANCAFHLSGVGKW